MHLSSLFTRRSARIAGQAVVVTALIGGTTAYAYADTTVELSVDGKTEEVRSFGRSVSDVLDSADVEVGARDVVAPALDEKVADGDTVVVNHARELRLTVDGETRTVWTTARTVDAALDDAGIRDGALVSASRSQPLGRAGLDVEVSTPKDVSVVADGERRDIVTPARTVDDALAEAKVTVGEHDRLSVPAESEVTDGLVVTVTRLTTETVDETSAIAFDVMEKNTRKLYKGDTKVVQAGRAGVRTVTSERVLADGREIRREVASDEVTREPVDKVVHVGTAERPAPKPSAAPSSSKSSTSSSSSKSSSSSSSSAPAVSNGSAWDRLAQCEAGGNWSINTGNGYYGGLQFSASSWRAVGGSGLPHQASRATQIAMGEKLKAAQGWGAWPSCSAKLGLR